MSSIQDLIAAEKAKLAASAPEEFPVVVGGTQVTVTFARAPQDEWSDLVATHPARPGSTDTNIGYNENTLPRAYPVEYITLDGERPDADTWRDLWAVLAPVHRATIGNVIWGLNVFPAIKEIRDLGKATAGKSSDSPAPKGSPRAASKGGSRRK